MRADPHHLRRINKAFYSGFSTVHWSMTIKNRATGWLTPLFHAGFREVLLHACHQYQLLCPVNCLMPDHLHLLLRGVSRASDQLCAATFLRRHVNALLAPHKFQDQAYDHVLRQEELGRGALQATAYYISENPVRAGLTAKAQDYAYSGAMIPSKPLARLHDEKFWDAYWNHDTRLREAEA